MPWIRFEKLTTCIIKHEFSVNFAKTWDSITQLNHHWALSLRCIISHGVKYILFFCYLKESAGDLDEALKQREELSETCAELKQQMAQVKEFWCLHAPQIHVQVYER